MYFSLELIPFAHCFFWTVKYSSGSSSGGSGPTSDSGGSDYGT